MGVLRPELVMKSIVPIVKAGVLVIYGLIISVIISTGSKPPPILVKAASRVLISQTSHAQRSCKCNAPRSCRSCKSPALTRA